MIKYIWSKFCKKIRGCAIKNSEIHRTSKIGSGSQVVGTRMGKYSYCGYDCKLLYTEIGNFCSIADNVVIGGAGHPIERVSSSPCFHQGKNILNTNFSKEPYTSFKKTKIGNDVWIAEGCKIKAGISVGNGAVIAMGSVVTKNIPAYEVWGGVPARCIKKRFSLEIAEQIEKVQWWDWEDKKIHQYACDFVDPEQFIKKIKD